MKTQSNSSEREDPQALLRRRQAARRLNFSDRKLHEEVHAGRIPYVRLGRLMMFIAKDLDDYIKAHRVG